MFPFIYFVDRVVDLYKWIKSSFTANSHLAAYAAIVQANNTAIDKAKDEFSYFRNMHTDSALGDMTESVSLPHTYFAAHL